VRRLAGHWLGLSPGGRRFQFPARERPDLIRGTLGCGRPSLRDEDSHPLPERSSEPNCRFAHDDQTSLQLEVQELSQPLSNE
jgi:hypothetical protein